MANRMSNKNTTKHGSDSSSDYKADVAKPESVNASDAILDKEPLCEPCFVLGNRVKSISFCMACDKKYCKKCSKHHRKDKETRDHTLADITDSSFDSEEICEPCHYNEKFREATNICTDCNEHMCDKCTNKHRSQRHNASHKIEPFVRQVACEVCIRMGKHDVPATSFCLDCDDPEMLCKSCAKYHLSSKMTRNHCLSQSMKIYEKRSRRKLKSMETGESKVAPLKPEKKPEVNKPGKPYVTETARSNCLMIKWKECLLTDIDSYQIMFKEVNNENREVNNEKWKLYKQYTRDTMKQIDGLLPQTSYIVKVRVINDLSGEVGPFSPESDKLTTGESPALEMKKKSTIVRKKPIPVYALPLKAKKSARNEFAKTRKLRLGKTDESQVQEKNLMIVGATGSGKSTLINAMANYIMDVSWEDPFRFTLINTEESEKQNEGNQALSQTEWVTCYIINPTVSQRLNYRVNLIDTPGFGDTRGLDQDKRIVQQIKELFTRDGKMGVATVDAVCFILKAPDARLSPTQSYIFEEILSLFGNDIKDNICTLITFADGQRPPVLAALKALEHKTLPYEKFFTFNNSALYACNSIDKSGTLSPFFWEMGMQSCKSFFDHLETLRTKSLTLTSEVLLQRERLENTITHLYEEIDNGLSKINVLEQEMEIFTRYKRQIRENQDFEYTVIENVQVTIDISGKKQYTTNCLQCNFTCHENCNYANDEDKARCVAMDKKSGLCTECPSYCHWTQHRNTPYIIQLVPQQKTKKYSEKQKIYEEATKKSLTQEQILDEMSSDIERLELAITDRMEDIARSNNRIKEIALRPDPLSTVQYINILIASEKREKKYGFEKRIDSLENVKKKAQYGKHVKVFKNRAQSTIENVKTLTLNEDKKPEEPEKGGFFNAVKNTVKNTVQKVIHAIKI